MSTNIKTNLETPDSAGQDIGTRDRVVLLRAFRLGVFGVLVLYATSLETTSLVDIGGALLITAAALLPSYLWCIGRAVGLPVFPIFALTHIWTFALPLLRVDDSTAAYSVADKFYAAMTVVGFLILATTIWFNQVKKQPRPAAVYRALAPKAGDRFLLNSLAGAAFFNMALVGGWLWIGGDVFAVIRNAVLACTVLAVIVVLCFRVSRYLTFSKYGLVVNLLAICSTAGAIGFVAFKLFSTQLPNDPGSIAGIISTLRSSLLGVGGLAVFGLSYRLGCGQLSNKHAVQFFILTAVNVISSAASLLLIGALSTFALTVVAYTIGRRRIPWLLTIAALLIFAFLHAGKSDIRDAHWGDGVSFIQPWEYPGLFLEWSGYSYARLEQRGGDRGQDEEAASLTERASLMQLLLLTEKETAHGTPLLFGETYIIIPELLIPRFLVPNKAASHEGTYILNIHYGKQTREETARTTIGWGLLNESYANFGLLGCAALAIVLGWAYGSTTRWSACAPLLSFRYLFTILLLSMAYQSEFSASVFVTALFQSTVILAAISFVFMRSLRSQNTPSLVSKYSLMARAQV